MALFPRKIEGRYMMIGRQDGKNITLLASDTLTCWDEEGSILMRPEFPWELVQMGNCGRPIECDAGWLLLTHGVGAMRKYSLGASLLARAHPSPVLGPTPSPTPPPAPPNPQGHP